MIRLPISKSDPKKLLEEFYIFFIQCFDLVYQFKVLFTIQDLLFLAIWFWNRSKMQGNPWISFLVANDLLLIFALVLLAIENGDYWGFLKWFNKKSIKLLLMNWSSKKFRFFSPSSWKSIWNYIKYSEGPALDKTSIKSLRKWWWFVWWLLFHFQGRAHEKNLDSEMLNGLKIRD